VHEQRCIENALASSPHDLAWLGLKIEQHTCSIHCPYTIPIAHFLSPFSIGRAADGQHRHTDRPTLTGHMSSGIRHEKADRKDKHKKYDNCTCKRDNRDKKEDCLQSDCSATAALECYNCHKKGHYANNCPHPKLDKLSKISKAKLLALGKGHALT